MYVMTTTSLDKDVGIAVLNRAIEAVTSSIEVQGGSISVKLPPKAVSQREEIELQAMMERLNEENTEVDGDAPEDI
jgi:translation initiation factor 2 subunit 1